MSSYLEPTSLSALLPFFSSVPEGGENLDTNQFWSNLVKEQNLTLDTSSVTHVARAKGIKSARMLQKKAAGMLLALQTLTRSLEEINATFEERTDCMALEHGLDSLPDEILSRILGEVTSDFTHALALSYVCSRFRQVILDSPRIWANFRLNTGMNLRKIKTFVDRSRICPLKIDVGPRCHHWNRRVKCLLSLKDQLEDIEFRCLSAYEGEHILRHYPAIRMPGLRKLTISSTFGHYLSHHFYVSWSLPNLKYLGFTNFIPKPVFRQNLSYCYMEFKDFFGPEELKLFLHSLTSLKTLEIELNRVFASDSHSDDEWESDDDDDSVQGGLNSRVSSIASFSFSIIGRTSKTYARRVLEAICPYVTEMSFSIVYPECYDHHDYAETSFRRACHLKPMRHFSMLKKLHLRLSGPDTDHSFYLREILPHVPRLENLRIEAPGHTLMPVCDHTTPELRALHFSNCDKMHIDFLTAVRDEFLCGNVVIGKVEVVGCRLIDEETLRDAFPNSEVVWRP
ncbi:hypothetical protein DFH11DRAFT_1237718 [Phellopilus nigrolimitatus]|nr:hypothetical protein DFH11DRAFT_1237718 [Phellopilus nigrolimitatus]